MSQDSDIVELVDEVLDGMPEELLLTTADEEVLGEYLEKWFGDLLEDIT